MTDFQLDSWARSNQAFLTLEVKIGGVSKYGSIFDIRDLLKWTKAQLKDDSKQLEYWLVTVKNKSLTRRIRSVIHKNEKHILEMAENCLASFERGIA